MRTALAVLLLVVFTSATARAQNCDQGCACGNTCISCLDTCRVGGGDADNVGGGAAQPVDPTFAIVVGALVVLGVVAVACFALALYAAGSAEASGGPGGLSKDDREAAYRANELRSEEFKAISARLRKCLDLLCGGDDTCHDEKRDEANAKGDPVSWMAERNCPW